MTNATLLESIILIWPFFMLGFLIGGSIAIISFYRAIRRRRASPSELEIQLMKAGSLLNKLPRDSGSLRSIPILDNIVSEYIPERIKIISILDGDVNKFASNLKSLIDKSINDIDEK